LIETASETTEAVASERPSSEALLLAAVGYLPLLFFLPLFVGKREAFARFHGRQSLVMFVGVLAFNIVMTLSDLVLGRVLGSMFILGFFFKAVAWLVHYPVGTAVSLAYLLAVAVGVVNAATGQCWRIPVVGAYAERLRL